MSIKYTYKITATNEQARCMEVEYSSEGLTTYLIGTRLPFEGEPLENVIQMYAPVPQWVEESTPMFVPEVGTEGEILPPVIAPIVTDEQTTLEQPVIEGAQTL